MATGAGLECGMCLTRETSPTSTLARRSPSPTGGSTFLMEGHWRTAWSNRLVVHMNKPVLVVITLDFDIRVPSWLTTTSCAEGHCVQYATSLSEQSSGSEAPALSRLWTGITPGRGIKWTGGKLFSKVIPEESRKKTFTGLCSAVGTTLHCISTRLRSVGRSLRLIILISMLSTMIRTNTR